MEIKSLGQWLLNEGHIVQVPNFINWDDWILNTIYHISTISTLECEVAGCKSLPSATSVHAKRMQRKCKISDSAFVK